MLGCKSSYRLGTSSYEDEIRSGGEGENLHDVSTSDFLTRLFRDLFCDGDDFGAGDEEWVAVGIISKGLFVVS